MHPVNGRINLDNFRTLCYADAILYEKESLSMRITPP